MLKFVFHTNNFHLWKTRRSLKNTLKVLEFFWLMFESWGQFSLSYRLLGNTSSREELVGDDLDGLWKQFSWQWKGMRLGFAVKCGFRQLDADVLWMHCVTQRHLCWTLVVHWHQTIVTLAAAATLCAVRRVVGHTATRRRASWRSQRRARKTVTSWRRLPPTTWHTTAFCWNEINNINRRISMALCMCAAIDRSFA